MVRLLALLVVLAGCPFTAPTPLARVRKGPAAGHVMAPIASLPVTCTSWGGVCTNAYEAAVTSATRMELEYAGYSLFDSELLNAEMLQRTTTTTASGDTTELRGTTWYQLSPAEQSALLVALGVRGVLKTTILIGGPIGMAQQRTVTVAIELTRLADGALAWGSKCSVETGDFNSMEHAIDLATRCALESATLW